MKILFVENHSVFAQAVIREFLNDHHVDVVPSIKSAIEHYEDQRFELILVDYDLDDGKGSEFVSKLRAAGDRIPMVAVSSHDRGNELLLKAGVNVTCPKMQFRNINKVIGSLFKGGT